MRKEERKKPFSENRLKKRRNAYCTTHKSVENENTFQDNFDFPIIREKQQQKNILITFVCQIGFQLNNA